MENSLVSICVITYNSAETIIETLESIKFQTYSNIELIISDDCSTDNTVDLCLEWLKINKHRFANYQLLRALDNKGISVNLNKAMECAAGEWIKPIAGDDILINSCIHDNVNYIILKPEVLVLFSDMVSFFTENDGCVRYNYKIPKRKKKVAHANLNLQFRFVCYFGLFMSAPTMFIKKSVFEKIKNDERIPMMEDLPFHFNLLRNGIKLSYMSKYTVYYRISESITNSTSRLLNPAFVRSMSLFHEYYRVFMPNTILGNLINIKNRYWDKVSVIAIRLSKNRRQSIIGKLYLFHGKLFEYLSAAMVKIYLR